MDTLSRELTVPVLFWLPFLNESTLKGNNLLLQEQIFSFETRPYYRGPRRAGKKTGGHIICLPF